MPIHITFVAIVALLSFLSTLPAHAHNVGESYLYLQIYDHTVTGRFEIALGDFNHALGREGWSDEITPENFAEHLEFVQGYYRQKVSVFQQGRELPLRFTGSPDVLAAHGGFARLPFELEGLDGVPEVLTFDYNVLFDEEPDHEAFLLVEHHWASGTFANESGIARVFRNGARRQDFRLPAGSVLRGVAASVAVGAGHIWDGIEYVLLLIALALPAVMRRDDGTWRPVERLVPALVATIRPVTICGLAFGVSCGLAASGFAPGAPLVEILLAVGTALFAVDILRPFLEDRRWLAMAGFGLVGGFDLARHMFRLGLLGEHVVLTVLGATLGVALALVVSVAILVPLVFPLRSLGPYPWGLRIAAVGLLLIAGVWWAERTFGVDVPMWELLPPWLQRIVP